MSGFLNRLTPEALGRLRIIVRRVMLAEGFPASYLDSDIGKREIDKTIDTYSQRTAEDLAKRGMKAGLIEKKVTSYGRL